MDRRSFLRLALFGGAAGATGALGVRGYYVEPDDVEVTFHTLATRKLARKLRIVHLSDLHLDGDRGRDFVPGLVSGLKPDIIALTGDYLNWSAKKRGAIKRLEEYVGGLKASLGVYATFGNWDSGFEDVLLAGTDVITIRGSAAALRFGGGSLNMAGLDFSWNYEDNASRANDLAGGLDRGSFNVFLYHAPDLVEDVAPLGAVDLYLAGHTHGGQVRIPFLRALKDGFKGEFPYAGAVMTFARHGTRYESGRFELGSMTAYVSRGIGLQGGSPPVRLFCRPEVAVFDIIPAAG